MARLATLRPNGRPHIVPITFALVGETLYTAVDSKPKSTQDLQRLRNIEASHFVSVLVDHFDEDWTRLWWCRLDGRARVVGEAERPRALEALTERYAPYRLEPPAGPVVAVDVERWTGWAAEAWPPPEA